MSYSPSILSAFSTALRHVHATGGREPDAALPVLLHETTAEDLAYLSKLIEDHRRQAAQPRLTRPTAETPHTEPSRFSRLRAHGLTPRECEVVFWITEGKRDAEIAAILGCAPKTVNKHVEHVLAKLGAETRLAAAHAAREKLRHNA